MISKAEHKAIVVVLTGANGSLYKSGGFILSLTRRKAVVAALVSIIQFGGAWDILPLPIKNGIMVLENWSIARWFTYFLSILSFEPITKFELYMV